MKQVGGAGGNAWLLRSRLIMRIEENKEEIWVEIETGNR